MRRVAAGAIVRIVVAAVVARQNAFAAAAHFVGVAAEMAGAKLVLGTALSRSDGAAGVAANVVATILVAVAAVEGVHGLAFAFCRIV